jgi:pimeloyl-ACP methyl ester carboxylesterase
MRLDRFAWWLRRGPVVREEPLFTVVVEGRGRDVILLHGLAASPDCWTGAREQLGPDVRLHTVHMRGFAGLPAPGNLPEAGFLPAMASGLADYIRRHAGGRAAVVGHSMGGLATLVLGRDHPGVTDRLMVVDVPSFFSVLISPFATASSIAGMARMARRQYAGKDAAGLEEQLRRTGRTLVTSDASLEAIVDWGMTSDQAFVADVMSEVMVTDLRPDLPSIAAPVDILYAWDKTAPTTRIGLDQIYATSYAGLPDHRRQRIDGARHYIMLDRPDAFYAAMRNWLGRKGIPARA